MLSAEQPAAFASKDLLDESSSPQAGAVEMPVVEHFERAAMLGEFDGDWELAFESPLGKVATWLKSFSIVQGRVIDGEGRICRLRMMPDGQVLFEGGVLERWGACLVRRGKKHVTLLFKLRDRQND
eukprot:gnl/TRDRNA2_/TRDRNA2_194963_c0_seq1.p1 gnl/TRDRNA2_/TRDRNA2_194963_c0~~gnl/TRDRNA2_/TRDRNA2_194963_c0_seq1.p1  ORF type:complete len:126 (+),score=21.36 gnl/TRDRNA2_/TRDRNA2_194963_c0_seq1:58-435(+)